MKEKGFVLVEAASGYSLLSFLPTSPLVNLSSDYKAFKEETDINLVAFQPFVTSEQALENAQAIANHTCTELLQNFLVSNLPKLKKSKAVTLGVQTPQLGNSILKNEEFKKLEVKSDESINELLRSVRFFLNKLVPMVSEEVGGQARLGLGHSFSRTKISFNVNKQDNMVIQASALLQQLDKDVNTNAMRVKEWYSFTFPELGRLVPDPVVFSRFAQIHVKKLINENEDGLVEKIDEIIQDEDLATRIVAAGKSSMGYDISDGDFETIETFAKETVDLARYRLELLAYLSAKLDLVAPNLTAILGEQLTGRLITHAGGLTSLAKCPASTVQILGAEKALFRALKSKGKIKTPKYGLLFNSGFISKAKKEDKGKVSRYLANKCVLAARIDAFAEDESIGKVFGDTLKEQIEDRVRWLASGLRSDTAQKNVDLMLEVASKLNRKRGSEAMEVDEVTEDEVSVPKSPEKSAKKKKKSKKEKSAKKKKKKKE